jgi:hypothetical protein
MKWVSEKEAASTDTLGNYIHLSLPENEKRDIMLG